MKASLLFIAALTVSSIIQAQDAAISWVKKNGPLGGEIVDIEVDPATAKIFLLDGSRRPYVSDDNGSSWERLTFSGNDRYFNDIEITNGTIYLVGGYDLYASTDGGSTFLQRMTDTSPYQDGKRLKRMPISGDLVVLAYNQLYTSSDNGQTWTPRAGLDGIDQHYYLAINAVDQIFILKAHPSTFEVKPYRSSDGGVSFTEVSTGIPAGHHVHSLAAENDGARLYCITPEDIFFSTDGASGWTSIKNGSMTDLSITDYGQSHSYIEFSADGLGMFFIDNLNHKLHSKTLSETSWSLRASGFPSGTLTAICASARDYPDATSATAFFGTSSGVFRTVTGGASVTPSNTGLASVNAEQISSDAWYGHLYLKTANSGTYNAELLKSEDQGNTWSTLAPLPTQIQYFSQTEGALFVLDAVNALHRSYNQGSSWYTLTPPVGFEWAGAVDADKVFGLSSSSFYYSNDNGETWTATAIPISGLPASFSIYHESIRMGTGGQMLLNLWDSDLGEFSYYGIAFTYDTNDNITSAVASKITNLPFAIDDVYKWAATNGKFYLYDTYSASADRIAISDDGGANWVTRTVPNSMNFFVTRNGYLFFADGSADKLHISRDEAQTFIETSLPSTVDVYDLRDITLDNNGYAYLAINRDYLYQSANTIVLPSSPSDLRTIGMSATAVALDWLDPNTYDRDIIIERSVNGVDFVGVGQVSGWDVCNYSSGSRGYFVDTKVQGGTTYTYRVKAKNAAGDSAPSSVVTVTTLAACTPDIPENRSWAAINSGTEGYSLLASPVQVGIKHLGGGDYQISDLTLGLTGSGGSSFFNATCTETLVVKAGDVNANGNGTWDGTTLALKWRACHEDKTETIFLTLNGDDPAPAKPAALRAYVVSNTSIEIKWPSAYYEKTYVLERSLSATSGFSTIATLEYPLTAYIDNGPLTEGTTYYYRLKALNADATPEESPYSDAVSIPFNKPNFIVADNAITSFNSSATLGSIWADFNNDGLEDYLTMLYDGDNQLSTPMIFKNLGSGAFEGTAIDLGDEPYFLVSVADYDNDHYPDLALNGDQARVLDIFKGNGNFTFTNIPSGQLGDLAIIEKEVAASSWADINNDGLPDLLVLNNEDGSHTLYKQNADHSFTKIIQGAASNDEPLLAIWADYDNDGYQDVLIGNLDGTGGLHRNNGNETFTKITDSGFDGANYFSAAWGDYNNDGNIDLFCGSTSLNALYKNNGNGTFTKDVSTSVSEANFTTGAAWGDYNNDGYLDLMTVSVTFNGHLSRLFLRDPTVTSSVAFKKIINEKINDAAISHYSIAHADPDKNGLLDLSPSAFLFDDDYGDTPRPTNNNFYQNNNAVGYWSEVKLKPKSGSTEALGARIKLTAGGITQTREIAATTSLISRNSTIVHFGLGTASTITNIEVRWPNGSVQNYPGPPVNQILVIDEDVVGPIITSHTPAANATGISPNTSITLVFDEEPTSVSGKKIYLTKTGQTSPFTSIDVSGGTKTSNQIVYTLPVSLEPLTEYNVTIDAGGFLDRYTNASTEIATGTWKFVTSDAPAITTLIPGHNSTNISALTTLSITFDRTITGTSEKFINVYKSTDLTTPIQTIDAANGAITNQTVVFTLPSKLQRSITYQVSIDAGAFVDSNGAGFQGLPSSEWVFTTDPGPSYTVSPAHNSIDVPVDAVLEISFSENVTAATGKNIVIIDGTTVVSEGTVAAVGTLSANVYSYPAPNEGWPYSKVLKVILDEGAFTDSEGNDSAPVVVDNWNFTTVAPPDTEPPAITFTNPGSLPKGFNSVSPSITVTDEGGMNSVVVSIRKISGSSYSQVPASSSSTAHTYTATFSEADHFDAVGAEFYITATDLAGNTKRDPVDPTATHKVYISYTAAQAAIPTTSLGLGGQKGSWKVFAIPFDIPSPNNGVTAIFNEIASTSDKKTFRLITYGTPTQWSEYPDAFSALSRGTGYFINIKQDPGAIALFDLTAPANNRSNLFEMNLKQGWNMVGNPYLTTISWDDVAALNGLSGAEAQLKTFSNGAYSNDQTLGPYEGGFVNITTAKTILIPFQGQTSSGGRRGVPALDDDISAEAWALPLSVQQGGIVYTLAGIGMAPDADLSIDNYDDLTPPRFFDFLEVNFSHPEHIAKNFTRDVVPTQQNYTWDFTIDSNLEGLAELIWNNAPLSASGKDIFLLDVRAQKLIDMKARSSYIFDPKASSHFRIFYGNNLRIAPEEVRLGDAYPNPTNGLTTIAFSLPETGGLNQLVSLEIVDNLGRPIGIVKQGLLNPGYHEASFDAAGMVNGFYTYRLNVKNGNGRITQVNKLIIK